MKNLSGLERLMLPGDMHTSRAMPTRVLPGAPHSRGRRKVDRDHLRQRGFPAGVTGLWQLMSRVRPRLSQLGLLVGVAPRKDCRWIESRWTIRDYEHQRRDNAKLTSSRRTEE